MVAANYTKNGKFNTNFLFFVDMKSIIPFYEIYGDCMIRLLEVKTKIPYFGFFIVSNPETIDS